MFIDSNIQMYITTHIYTFELGVVYITVSNR